MDRFRIKNAERVEPLPRLVGAVESVLYGSPLIAFKESAISAHWSAELRAKVAAAATAERDRVLVDIDDEDRPW